MSSIALMGIVSIMPITPPSKKKLLADASSEKAAFVETLTSEPAPKFDLVQMREQVSKLLKFSTFQPEHRYWLDTQSQQLNAVLGSKVKGLPYGKVYELAGLEHGGKTMLSVILAAMAQKDGAAIGYVDLDNSYDPVWCQKLGLDTEKLYLIEYKLADAGKKGSIPRLQSAEELFTEAEATMHIMAKHGFQKQFWIVDHVAAIVTQKIYDAGLTGQSMNSKLDRAAFLWNLLPRWAGLCANYNITLLCLNQLKNKVGVFFGDPYETAGGRAIKTTCAIRARVRRLKNGQLKHNGRTIGIVGILKNVKNKAGEGSRQDEECGLQVRWNRSPALVEFMSKSEAEAILKGE